MDLTDGCTVEVAAAGHPLPIAITGEGAFPVGRHGTLAGVFERLDVSVDRVELGPGDSIVFWTDGVTDMPPPYGRTADDLARLLSGHQGCTAAGVIETIRADLDCRVTDAMRDDDVAILVVRRATGR